MGAAKLSPLAGLCGITEWKKHEMHTNKVILELHCIKAEIARGGGGRYGGQAAPALMQRGDPAFISTLWPPCDSSEDCHKRWWQTGLLCTASTGCHPRLWLGTFWKCQSHMIMNIKQPCIAHDYLTGGGDLTDAGEQNLIASRDDAWGY